MTTYNTYSKQLISNYACIATLEPTEIVVGQSITVGALGSPFDGSFTVLDLPQYAFTGIDSDTGEWDLTAADLFKSIYDAAAVTLAATNMLPTHMFVDPATWVLIMKLADTTGRPLFANYGGPGLQGVNAIGVGNTQLGVNLDNNYGPLGLKLVVDNNFAAKTMVIMKDIGFEIYEAQQGILSVPAPSILARTFSYYGYFATFVAKSSFIQSIAIA